MKGADFGFEVGLPGESSNGLQEQISGKKVRA